LEWPLQAGNFFISKKRRGGLVVTVIFNIFLFVKEGKIPFKGRNVEFYFHFPHISKNIFMNPLLYSLLKNYQQEQLLLNSFRNENSTLFPLFTPPNQSPPSPELSLLAFLGSPIFANHLLPLCSLPDFNKNLIKTSISNTLVDSISNSTSINDTETNSQSTSSSSSEARTKQNEGEYFKEYKIGTKVVRRLSYPREFKLIVLHSYWTNGKNKYRTCKEFHITKFSLFFYQKLF